MSIDAGAAEEEELERYALPAHAYGRLTGASLAVHAVPDAFLVLHTGVGCKYKGAGQYCLHDLGRPSHHREGYTEVSDLALVRGSAERVGIYARSWYKKRKPAFMAVTASTFLEMTGEDFARAARDAAATVPCELAYIPSLGFEGDLYEGYASVVAEICRRLPFASSPPRKGSICVVGYPFDRYELDHSANLRQLRYLVESLGLECGPVLLSGRPYAELMRAASCERFLLLPYAWSLKDELERLSGRPAVRVGLPVGLGGTRAWLAQVADAAGVPRRAAEASFKKQLDYAAPMLDLFRGHASQRLGSGGLAVFAETPLAAGLASLGAELGLKPRLAGLRDRSLGGRPAFEQAYRASGLEPPPELEVVVSPSLEKVRRLVGGLQERGSLAALMASHTELACLNLRERAGPWAAVEIGFPSIRYHALTPMPFYGVEGALAQAHRLLNAGG